jgi:hypothetical protein
MADSSITKVKMIDNITVQLDSEDIARNLHMDKKKGGIDDIRELVELANSIMTPRALYGVAYISSKSKDMIKIGDTMFTSHVLSANLDSIGKLFPYIITIGKALEEKSSSFKLLNQYLLDEIGNIALRTAREYLEGCLKREYQIAQLSSMSPGRLADWPITEQKQLFSLFGDTDGLIGVTLNDSMLMLPKKSVSGVFFPTEVYFESCQLCPREKCEGRKAPYDDKLANSYSANAA